MKTATKPVETLSPDARSYRWTILGVGLFAQLAGASVSQALLSLTALYQADLSLTRAEVGMIASAGALGHVVILIFAGILTDTQGIRRMLLIGLLVAGAGLSLFVVAPTYLGMLGAIFVAGVGASLASPAITKTVVRWFSQRSRATAMGIKQTGVPLSGGLAALLLLPLGVASGWRVSVLVLAGVVTSIAVVSFALYRDPPETGQAPDHANGRSPLWETLGLRDVWLVGILALSLVAVQFVVITYLVIYLKEFLLLPVVVAGGYLALANAGGLGTRVLSGVVSDRLLGGRRKPLLVGFGLLATALLVLMALVGPATPLLLVAVLVTALGVAAIGSHGLFLTLMAEMAGTRIAATSVGLGLTLVQVGATLGPPVFGLLVDGTGSYPLAWGVFAGLTAGGTVAVTLVQEREAKE